MSDKASAGEVIVLDGESLSTGLLYRLGHQREGLSIKLSEEAWTRVRASRAVVDGIVQSGEVVYGVSTGFGKFSQVHIPAEQRKVLQENLIRSHACGVGNPLPIEIARMMLALRINILAKGFSGISEDTLTKLIAAWNADCISYVPEKGTVGASGDLAPLSHLALGLLGEGKMWDPESKAYLPAADVLKKHSLATLNLAEKEGLALINGTQFITSIGSVCVERARILLRTADVAGALSLEGLRGSVSPFNAKIHAARPHTGQNRTAARLRALLNNEVYPSEIAMGHQACGTVQDPYTLRCMPQVHGVVNDTVEFVAGVLDTEINSATDNPMVFSDEQTLLSCGNFHGEYPAKMCDYLAIGVQELANISERRIERLMNPDLSKLPAFLVVDGGLNSGFMISHCTAAALTSENKTLCYPGSSDTLSTSSAKEDHVSMGGWAARKCLEVIKNVETVIAIEIMCAVQAVDLLKDIGGGARSTDPLMAVYDLVRADVPYMAKDRFLAPDIDAVTDLVRSGKVWRTVEPFLRKLPGTDHL